MNKVIIAGNVCNNIELRENGKIKVCGVRIAIKRNYKTDNEYKTDFISCDAFGQVAEFIAKYFKKGSGIMVVGRIENNNYQAKDGSMRYQDHVVIEQAEFNGAKVEEEQQPKKQTQKVDDEPLPSDEEFDLDKLAEEDSEDNTFNVEISEEDLPF